MYLAPFVAKLDAASDDDARFALPVYEDLSIGAVRKALGLSAEQRKELQRIADGYRTKMEGPAKESEIEAKRARLESEVRPQIERLLTPEQLAALKDIVFRTALPSALADAKVQEKIALNREQKESLARIRQESDDVHFRAEQARNEKASALLTPEQREKLYRVHYAGGLNFDELTSEQKEIIRHASRGPELKDEELTPEQREKQKDGTLRYNDLTPEQKEKVRRMMPGSGDSGSPRKTGNGTLTLTGANQRAPSGKEGKTDGTASFVAGTALTLAGGWDSTLDFPVYSDLWDANQRKRYGIEFSAEQWKKIREISADWRKKYNELTKDKPKTTDQKEWEKYAAPLQAKAAKLSDDCRKQVEAVLTPQQLQTYQRITLIEQAGPIARQPDVCKSMGITLTAEQREKLNQIGRDAPQVTDREVERLTRVVVAAISSKQREQLRLAVEQRILANDEAAWRMACAIATTEEVTKEGLHLSLAAPEPKNVNAVQQQFELRYEPTAKKLELTADQRKQLSAIDAEQQSKTEKLLGEARKFPHDQRTGPEVQEKAAQIRQDVRQSIQAILTPEQSTALKETEFGMGAVLVLILPEPNNTGANLQQKMALNEQQLAIVRRVREEFDAYLIHGNDELNRKSFEVLTTEQRNKIRDFLAKQRGW